MFKQFLKYVFHRGEGCLSSQKCAISALGHGDHIIYKMTHISVIKVCLYPNPFSFHTVNVVLNHDNACLHKR